MKTESDILTIVEAPIVDVCAIGCVKGEILLANLLTDEIISWLHQEGPANSLSFSTDADLEKSILVSSSNRNLIFWDLNENKITCKIESPHHDGMIDKV